MHVLLGNISAIIGYMKNGNIAIFPFLGMKNSELVHICEYVIPHTNPNSDIYHILESKYAVKKIKVWLFLSIFERHNDKSITKYYIS